MDQDFRTYVPILHAGGYPNTDFRSGFGIGEERGSLRFSKIEGQRWMNIWRTLDQLLTDSKHQDA